MIHVLVQADDADDVRPRGYSPVELHLSPSLGAVVQNLRKTIRERVRAGRKVWFWLSVNTLLEIK